MTTPLRSGLPAIVGIFTLALVLVFCRGLNASFEHTSRDQVRLTDLLLAGAPNGSTILSLGPTSLLFDVNTVDRISFEEAALAPCQADVLGCVKRADADFLYAPYQIFALARWTLGVEPSEYEDDLRRAAQATGYRAVVDTPELIVFAKSGMPDPIAENEVPR